MKHQQHDSKGIGKPKNKTKTKSHMEPWNQDKQCGFSIFSNASDAAACLAGEIEHSSPLRFLQNCKLTILWNFARFFSFGFPMDSYKIEREVVTTNQYLSNPAAALDLWETYLKYMFKLQSNFPKVFATNSNFREANGSPQHSKFHFLAGQKYA